MLFQSGINYNLADPWWRAAFEKDEHLLGLLRTEFVLQPWLDVEERLEELQRLYLPFLELHEDD